MSRESPEWGDSLDLVRNADTLFPEVRRCCATCIQWASSASASTWPTGHVPPVASCASSYAQAAPLMERSKYGAWETVTDYALPLVPVQTTALSLCTQHTYRHDITVNGKPWTSPSPKTPR
jgi:hypothetical protein